MQQPSASSSFEGICCLVGFDCYRNVRVEELTDGNSNRGVLNQSISAGRNIQIICAGSSWMWNCGCHQRRYGRAAWPTGGLLPVGRSARHFHLISNKSIMYFGLLLKSNRENGLGLGSLAEAASGAQIERQISRRTCCNRCLTSGLFRPWSPPLIFPPLPGHSQPSSI